MTTSCLHDQVAAKLHQNKVNKKKIFSPFANEHLVVLTLLRIDTSRNHGISQVGRGP